MALTSLFSRSKVAEDEKIVMLINEINGGSTTAHYDLMLYTYSRVRETVENFIADDDMVEAVMSATYKNIFTLLANGAKPKNFELWAKWLAQNNAIMFGKFDEIDKQVEDDVLEADKKLQETEKMIDGFVENKKRKVGKAKEKSSGIHSD